MNLDLNCNWSSNTYHQIASVRAPAVSELDLIIIFTYINLIFFFKSYRHALRTDILYLFCTIALEFLVVMIIVFMNTFDVLVQFERFV